MEEKFKNVLHEDEKVLFTTKASHGVIWGNLLGVRVLFTCILLMPITGLLIGRMTADQESKSILDTPLGIIIAVIILLWVIVTLMNIGYKNNYYICLTESRIIIRHGVINYNYAIFDITNVSGNITISQKRTIFDRSENVCELFITIELLPVGHNKHTIITTFVENGYELSKAIEKQVKINAKTSGSKPIEE